MISPSSLVRIHLLIWLGLGTLCATEPAPSFDHSDLDVILKERVSEGLVDYKALKEDPRLEAYLRRLAVADTSALGGRDEQLAFWINAYNAYTLKLVLTRYPVKSIRDIPHGRAKTPWDLYIARVGGRALTLNDIEHKILRGELKEPRIHYAVVCAAISCPPLRAEAYTAARLEAQLTDQARGFLARQNRFDEGAKRAELSLIFQWFASDFGGDQASLLRTVAPYAPEPVRESLLGVPEKWTVTYLDYDWRLNERR